MGEHGWCLAVPLDQSNYGQRATKKSEDEDGL